MTSEASGSRLYERTHPWLTFSFDLRGLNPADWLALGKAAAMSGHIAGVPLDPQAARDFHKLYLAKGVLATTAIEGNTLSEDEARKLIDGALALPPSRQYLGREIENIVEACNMLTDDLEKHGRIPLTVESIERMNGIVLRGLDTADYVAHGKVRTTSVSVGAYRCPHWRDAEYLLARLCETLNDFVPPAENRWAFAIVKAVFAHLYLVWIHPFGDGNGRTARLIELAILLEAGLPQPVCHLLSNHYNLTRSEYYRQLARSSREENGIFGFTAYAVAGLVDGLGEQIDSIREHQWDAAWVNFVHERFREISGAQDRRRRSLVLALSQIKEEVRVRELPNLNAELARGYARVSSRTLFRDVDQLLRQRLLTRGANGVRANRERILAFLPWRHEPAPDAD